MHTVAVVGLGYIGLPTAAVLAARHMNVIGVDVNRATIDTINSGEAPFLEPDLREALVRAVAAGRLHAQAEMPRADVYILAVPTPFTPDKEADLRHIDEATDALAAQLRGGELVVLESTSPPGTTARIAHRVALARPDLSDGAIDYAHCPERVLPGRVMIELVENDRIVGGLTPAAAERAAALYRLFCRGRIFQTDARTAELAKLVENSYRDVNIAFANELSRVCQRLGVDVWELIALANHHPRVEILQPGPGVGGHCIAVDPWFIVAAAPEDTRLIRTAREDHDSQPERIVSRIVRAVQETGTNDVALLGLAFKKNIDDLRESPAVTIAESVARAVPDVHVRIVEPHVAELPRQLQGIPNVSLCEADAAVRQAAVVGLLVDHDDFLGLDPGLLESRRVIDTRGLWRVDARPSQ